MKIKLLFIFSFSFFIANAQVAFNQHTLLDHTDASVLGQNSLVDIDQDGDLDLVSRCDVEKAIVYFPNLDGNGTLGNHIFLAPTGPAIFNDYKLLDIDGDGDKDLFLSTSEVKVGWFENLDGLGTFGGFNSIYENNATNTATAEFDDIDSDGDFDVILSLTFLQKIYLFENIDGNGTFSSETLLLENIEDVKNIKNVDLNEDGAKDLIISTGTTTPKLFIAYNNGMGVFLPLTAVFSHASQNIFNVADLDADNDLDIIVANSSSAFWIENLNGTNDFSAPQEITLDSSDDIQAIDSFDIDSDGDLDIIYITNVLGRYTLTAHENLNGMGNFAGESIIYENYISAREMLLGDLNGDNLVDILVGDFESVFFHENPGMLGDIAEIKKLTRNNYSPSALRAEDIDGDSYPDLIVASKFDSQISWHKNLNGLGNYGPQIILSNHATLVNKLTVSDIDDDGDNDLFVELKEGFGWYENLDGLGTFSDFITVNIALVGVTHIEPVDMDADGDIDFLVSGEFSNTIGWCKNLNGTNDFSFQTIDNTVGRVKNVIAADFDGDGDLDVAAAAFFDQEIVLFKNLDGQGTFGPKTVIADIRSRKLSAVDLDLDGDLDIISYNDIGLGTGQFIENIDGNGTFAAPVFLFDVALFNLADLDNDGDMDFFDADEDLTWVENLGNMAFEQPAVLLAGLGLKTEFATVADLNGNGKMDIVGLNDENNLFAWVENLGSSNEIVGSVTFDFNNDGCDPNDILASNILVKSLGINPDRASLTSEEGAYNHSVNIGTAITSIVLPNPSLFSVNPTSYQHTFTTLGAIETANFCIEPIGTVNDLAINMLPIDGARPGFESKYILVYENLGNTMLSGQVTLVFDSVRQSFVMANPVPDNTTATSLEFYFNNLLPFEQKTIAITMDYFPTPINNEGDIVVFNATIDPVVDDNNPLDNSLVYEQTIVNSFDPNDKIVAQGDEIEIDEVGDYLDYIVRFQNTGTADAINVRIEDVLSDNLEWDTFRILSSSHNYSTEILEGNKVAFIFDNINLPPQVTDPEGSKGYIAFQAKTKETLQVGNVIENTANIFFDFNAPITTNTVSTTIIEELSINDFNNNNSIAIYPNPTSHILNIKPLASIVLKSTIIYSTIGQKIYETQDKNIDVSMFSPGIYFLELNTNKGRFTSKFIKE